MKRFIILSLGVFIAILLVVAIVWSTTTGRSLDECFFGACCGILYITGKYLGFTYKEICVIVNIYWEAGLCLLSALWVTWTAIKGFIRRKTLGSGLLMATGIVCGLAYVGGFLWICHHYAMSMNDAFDLCYRELMQLAKDYHTTYNNVNYAIFILLFLAITIGNTLLVKLLDGIFMHKRKMHILYNSDN